jgi:hypothetical protein
MLLLLAMIAAVVSPFAVIYAAVGAAAVAHAAILFTRAPTPRLLVGSALVGLVTTSVGLSAATSAGGAVLGQFSLLFAGVAALASVACATATRLLTQSN